MTSGVFTNSGVFLDLGGDSLRAMLAVNKIQNLCGVKVSIADLYQHTIGELVGLIQAKIRL